MTFIQDLPDEIALAIVEALMQPEQGPDPTRDLMNLSCTCRAIYRIILPLRYRSLDVKMNSETLLPFAYLLMTRPDIALSVRHLEISPDLLEKRQGFLPDPRSCAWPIPADFSVVCATWVRESGYPTQASGWEQQLRTSGRSALVCTILWCCQSLRSLTLDVGTLFWDPDDLSLFVAGRWPWTSLQSICLACEWPLTEGASQRTSLLESILTSDASLEELCCVYLPVSKTDNTNVPYSVRVNSLKLTLGDSSYGDFLDHSDLARLLQRCRAIKCCDITIEDFNTTDHYPSHEALLNGLLQHRNHLDTLRLDLTHPAPATVMGGERDPTISNLMPRRAHAQDWREFLKMKRLHLPMPFLFGYAFFGKGELGTELPPPSNEFGKTFNTVLVDCLPTSIEIFETRLQGVWQLEAFLPALVKLLQHQSLKFPQLQRVTVFVDTIWAGSLAWPTRRDARELFEQMFNGTTNVAVEFITDGVHAWDDSEENSPIDSLQGE